MVFSQVHEIRATDSAAPAPTDQLARQIPITEDGDLLGRCSYWRNTLAGVEVAFPARLLKASHAAKWVHGNRPYIDVRSAEELELMLASGVPPILVIFDTEGAVTRTVWHAIGLGVGQLVVNDERQVKTLSAIAQRPRRVLVDITDERAEELLAKVDAYLDPSTIGLRCELRADAVQDVDRVMGRVRALLDHHGLTVTHLRLVVPKPQGHPPVEPRALATAIERARNDSYEHFGLPLLAMGVSVDWQTLRATRRVGLG